ncbi:hypothetical protein pv_221 [Pithovirus sibericum]|uniref:Uncharacterized protein n=1 Tax=Pithovirus sibericum TaxID=1450746 RepID=W5S4U8_9VIRU|nr:hypothetical protein pv_221 [Pithovirus sibericum]AHH01788.1 hypothetical protein pv_221 [Pithovirus sibericum]
MKFVAMRIYHENLSRKCRFKIFESRNSALKFVLSKIYALNPKMEENEQNLIYHLEKFSPIWLSEHNCSFSIFSTSHPERFDKEGERLMNLNQFPFEKGVQFP